MKLPDRIIAVITIVITLLFSGCNDNWDSYYKIDDENTERTILQGIENDAALSKYYVPENKRV